MPRYFFHLVAPGQYSQDEIGTELPDADVAYLQACEAALAIGFEMLQERRDPLRHSFEITDGAGTVLFHLPFSEVIHPAQHTWPLAELQAAIHRNQERAARVQSELKANFNRTRSLLASTRALLKS